MTSVQKRLHVVYLTLDESKTNHGPWTSSSCEEWEKDKALKLKFRQDIQDSKANMHLFCYLTKGFM